MVDNLSNDSSYIDIYNELVNINKEKNQLIKTKMNTLVNKLNFNRINLNLPIYLDYLLHMLKTSFPLIDPYKETIINTSLLIDKYDIHPYIYNSLFANILFSIYINEILSNPTIISNHEYLESISNIYNEIEMIFSIFNEIFIICDTEYKLLEEKMCYNEINGLSKNEFINYIDNIDKIDNNIIILNIMIIQIERLTQQNMNNYLLEFKYNNSDNKLENDLLSFNIILTEFNKNILDNYKYITKFESFNKLINIDLLKFEEKNSIYYWIDHIAYINGKLLDHLLKNN